MRKGKYDDAKYRILEFLYTVADNGRCPRPLLENEFNLPKSSASNILSSMENKGLIKIGKRSFNKIQSIEITEQGRSEYRSKYVKGEYRIPLVVKKYLSNRKLTEESLFPIQRNFVDRGLIYASKNACVFGYPGAGKTLVAEMSMIKEISEGGRVLYCTPYKALDWQKYTDFRESFKNFSDVRIAIADSDNRTISKELSEAKIIIATYERVLGAIKSRESWLDNISLVCADEITLLADDGRGGTLDIVLTSLKNLKQKPRLITISSLVGNALEISEWLGAEPLIENRPAFKVPVEEYVVYVENGKIFTLTREGNKLGSQSDKSPIEYLVQKNVENGMTTIVFTGTKYGAESIAKRLAGIYQIDPTLQRKVEDFFSNSIKHKTSQAVEACNLIRYGIAYHHAGLQKIIRRFIEELLRNNMLKTVVATTTLSHGVDYKIDSVIIDIEPMIRVKDGLTMIEYINLKGRTGRPGKSKTAKVYIYAGKIKPDKIFTKYFLSAPEPISPPSTFDEENIASMMLYESDPELDVKKTMSFLVQTFKRSQEPKTKIDFGNITNNLLEARFLKKSGKKIVLTDLGRRVNRSNLPTSDATKVLEMKDKSSDTILSVATQIDIAKRLNLNLSFSSYRAEMLKEFMKGKSMDEIRKSFGNFYDQELIELASYTSISLKKIDMLLNDKYVTQKILRLRKWLSNSMSG